MEWNGEFELLCRLDERPDFRHPLMRQYFPDITVRYILESLVPKIDVRWPEATASAFRVAATTAALATLDYEQFRVAVAMSHQALETSLRQRFEGEYQQGIPIRLPDRTVITCSDLGAFNACRLEMKARFVDEPDFTGSYAQLVRWCLRRSFLSVESAAHASNRGMRRNELRHASSDNRLAPGPALNDLDCDIALAKEAWFGEPAPWKALIVTPPPEVMRELIAMLQPEGDVRGAD